MIYNSRLVLLISLFIIFVKIESTNTPFTVEALSGCEGGETKYNYDKLVDGNIKTTWYTFKCDFEGQSVYYVEFKTNRLVEVYGYKITLASDGGEYEDYNPYKWVLKAKEKVSDTWTDIDSQTQYMSSVPNYGNFTYTVSKPGNYSYFAYVITDVQSQNAGNAIKLGEFWLLEIESCPNEGVAPQIGCKCGSTTNICNVGQICKDDQCLSSCQNDQTAAESACYCDLTTNICSVGQICKNDQCLSSCENDQTASERGCYCGLTTNICNQGQFCYSHICLTLKINLIISIIIFIVIILLLLLLKHIIYYC